MADALERGGRVVFNRDDDTWDVAVARAKHYRHELISFGRSSEADIRLLAADATPAGTRVRVDVCGKIVETEIAIPGQHMAMNVAAALAGIHALDGDVIAAGEALRGFEAVQGRSQIVAIPVPEGGTATLIDDSFNATPASIRSSLRLLGDHARQHGGRKLAVLGDVLHLGAASGEIHASFLADVEAAGVDALFTTGREMRALHDACTGRVRAVHADDLQALYDAIRAELRAGDVVTTKSSTPVNTIAIAKALRMGATTVDKTPPKF
jgi:UDP-N-acetylmuramyl pentapeptide synthase